MPNQQTAPPNPPEPREKENWIFYALVRWTVASILLIYGFAK